MSISTVNPYTNHPQLSSLEQEVLWEYAKLGDKTKRIASIARDTATTPNESLLAELRDLEKKMGLVLTLFKGSVFAILQEDTMQREDAQRAHQEADRQRQAEYDYQMQDQIQDPNYTMNTEGYYYE